MFIPLSVSETGSDPVRDWLLEIVSGLVPIRPRPVRSRLGAASCVHSVFDRVRGGEGEVLNGAVVHFVRGADIGVHSAFGV